MKILVINAGSSSLKYQLFDMKNESMIAKGICERIGIDGRITGSTADGRKFVDVPVTLKNHTDAFHVVKDSLISGEFKVLDSLDEIMAVGHRVVQGGSIFNDSVLVDEKVIEDIRSLCPLAPLHNPANLQGILASRKVFGTELPEVVAFDTSFHSTMPPEAYIFPIPYEFYENDEIRRYGFHGTSHRFVSNRCSEVMDKPLSELKIITCHLGNGSSIAAIKYGKVIDTTMGLTPLDGLMMGTRCGAIDPSVVLQLMKSKGYTPDEMNEILNKKSGYLGVSGVSSDDRDLLAAIDNGNERALLARNILKYQIKKYIGSYVAAMDGVDAIVFTGGIGENTFDLREDVCKGLTYLGITFNSEINPTLRKGREGELSLPDSKVKVYVLPTNEELVIARDAKRIAESLK